MDLLKYLFSVFFILVVMSQQVSAAASKCSYSKSVHQKGTEFDISSRPVSGCGVQVVKVSARQSGKRIASLRSDVDYLAQSAQVVDLTGDGRPELALISRASGGTITDVLDVYWLDGKTLRRSEVPELDEKSGYRGGDRFSFEGRLIVRTIPVYRFDDPAGKPSGGTRSLKYDFKEGAFSLYVQTESASNPSDDASIQSAAPAAAVISAETRSAAPAAEGLAVTEIRPGGAGIEIRANGVVKYKTMKLEKPERIAIDIRGANSTLAGKKIAIDRYGISNVRIGQKKGFLRIVLDSTLGKFPRNVVKPSDGGVMIEFIQ